MKILITGAAGFIGTHLAKTIIENGNNYIRLFDVKDINLEKYPTNRVVNDIFIGDIRSYKSIKKALNNIDTVFHLASLLGTDYLVKYPEKAVKVNTIGTLNLLRAANEENIRVIYLSLLPDWNSPYMVSKHAAEKFCLMYHEEYNLSTTIFRASHIYGEYQKWKPARKAIPNFIMSALRNRDIKIYGSGNQLMDLLYVGDATNAIYRITSLEESFGQTYELGTGIGYRVIDVANMIIKLCNSKSKIIYKGKRPGEPVDEESFKPAQIDKLQNAIGNFIQFNIEEGLTKTINWYKKFV